ncbi:hydrogen gas-evolving membrane-bound hydrogenase subunit E [Gelria sp. Kuro-4]|uniref:hydrogen gas-evolving membrane-bound hydrogenase subunit E n=1 Tax=Gelria sp. Kuro-4 TaxID=2796927 RepID=UPI001BF0638F|nr:hydrogen gas-evolving membrane-bound hydrogenase subunit E [Gelria sp. Kuro-4]MDI3522972.1 hypothetical protein [Bacillota bacterium]MDK2926959.1 hypothetical protein [Bacillota bacterium]BCV25350.1 hypothetical protein kuro4_21230 [Gelria sp. Kuro-4]
MRAVLITLILLLAAGALVAVALEMPPLGAPGAPALASPLTAYYQARAFYETACPNQVAAIVADYRAYDTLGETTVLFTAVAAILTLRHSRKEEKDRG